MSEFKAGIDEDYLFETTDEAGKQMVMDIPTDQGGHGAGVRPMQALLSALGGCSGVDVVMILKKQKETNFFKIGRAHV